MFKMERVPTEEKNKALQRGLWWSGEHEESEECLKIRRSPHLTSQASNAVVHNWERTVPCPQWFRDRVQECLIWKCLRCDRTNFGCTRFLV